MATGAWGEGSYSFGEWGIGQLDVSVTLTGLDATGSLGAVSVVAESNVVTTGVSASGEVGSVVARAGVTATVTGVEANGDTGSVNIVQSVTLTGVSATVNTARPLDTFTAYNNAKLSTAQYKFGDASAVFDGLFDYIRPDENSTWGSGDFTIEFWFYYSSIGASNYFLFDNRTDTTNGLLIFIDTSNRVTCVVNGGVGGLALTAVSTNTWNSVSLVRSGTAMSFYVNGTKIGNLSANSTNYSGRKYSIGASSYSSPGSFGFNGYIDEFRASTTARYSGASYTPATAEFSPDVYTTDLLHFDGANGSTVITNSATSGVIGVVGDAQVSVTGVQAVGALGEEEIIADTTVSITGITGTGSVGTVSTIGKAIVAVTGVQADGAIGTAVQRTTNYVTIGAGVEGTGELGTVSEVIGEVNVVVSGVTSTGEIGTASVAGKAVVDITGVVGTVALGEAEGQAGSTVTVTGVVGTMALGEVDENGKAVVTLTGVSAQGLVARPLVWGLIDTSQTPDWVPIAA